MLIALATDVMFALISSLPRGFVGCSYFCVTLALMAVVLSTDLARSDEPPSLLERFLEIDRTVIDNDELAGSIAHELMQDIAACREAAATEQRQINCLLGSSLHDSSIIPATDPTVVENTVTSALADRRGSCAALVGLVLALADDEDPPFDAVVLRDHVLLARRGARDEFFETLEQGQRLGKADLSRYGLAPHDDPVVVGPDEYVAYYIDNLAARLEQEGGAAERVESMFNEALEIAPKASRIRYNYGTFLLQQKRFAEAEAMLSGAIDAGWKDADAFVNRGAARWELGRIRGARRDFERALKLDPTNRQAKVNLQQLPH